MEESFEGVDPMGDSTDCGGACNRQWRGFMPRIHTLKEGWAARLDRHHYQAIKQELL